VYFAQVRSRGIQHTGAKAPLLSYHVPGSLNKLDCFKKNSNSNKKIEEKEQKALEKALKCQLVYKCVVLSFPYYKGQCKYNTVHVCVCIKLFCVLFHFFFSILL
jgi:hypothetical protein